MKVEIRKFKIEMTKLKKHGMGIEKTVEVSQEE